MARKSRVIWACTWRFGCKPAQYVVTHETGILGRIATPLSSACNHATKVSTVQVATVVWWGQTRTGLVCMLQQRASSSCFLASSCSMSSFHVAAPNLPDLTLPAGAGRQAFAGSCRASPAWGAVYAWSNMWRASEFRSSLLCFLFKPRDGARGVAIGAGHCNILMPLPHQHVSSAVASVLSLLQCTCIVGLWLRVERLACNSIAACDAAAVYGNSRLI